MGSWTTMSFSNLTQRNEIKAILGSVFNQPPNLDIRFNSSILFLEMFSVSKPLLRLPLVLMFNWSSYLSSLVDWFQNCQKYISRNCLITTQVRLVLCVWNDQIFYGGTQWCFAIIIFVYAKYICEGCRPKMRWAWNTMWTECYVSIPQETVCICI